MPKYVKPLRQLCQQHPLARAFLIDAAQRERSTRATSVQQTRIRLRRHEVSATHQEILALFRQFAAIGLGRVVIGRRKSPTRFQWNEKLTKLARTVVRPFVRKPAPVIPRYSRAPNLSLAHDAVSLALPAPTEKPVVLDSGDSGPSASTLLAEPRASVDWLRAATSTIWLLSQTLIVDPPDVAYSGE